MARAKRTAEATLRALLRAALLLAAAACVGSQPAADAQHAGIRLPLWRVKSGRARSAPSQQGTWLRPVSQPPMDDEQLYNHRDACVPRGAASPRSPSAWRNCKPWAARALAAAVR